MNNIQANPKTESNSRFDFLRLSKLTKAGSPFVASRTLFFLSPNSQLPYISSLPMTTKFRMWKIPHRGSSSLLSHLISISNSPRLKKRDAARQTELRESERIVIRGKLQLLPLPCLGDKHSNNLKILPSFS